jgi:thiaminase/transcriptional activator TenA
MEEELGMSHVLWNENKEQIQKIMCSEFLQGIANGDLDKKKFYYFLKQDEIYLNSYSRSFCIAGAKTPDNKMYRFLLEMASESAKEQAVNVELAEDNPDYHTPNEVTIKYTNFLTATAWQFSPLEYLVAASPCILIYEYMGRSISSRLKSLIYDYANRF